MYSEKNMEKDFPAVVDLNVGGTKFSTKLTTLQKYTESKLAAMFSGKELIKQDKDGKYIINRNGDHFRHILNFLRDDEYLPPIKFRMNVVKEAKYYKLVKLVEKLEQMAYVSASGHILDSYQRVPETSGQFPNIKRQILDKAISKVECNGTKFRILQSTVLLISCNESDPDGTFLVERMQNIYPYEHILDQMVPEHYKNRVVWIGRKHSDNFAEVADILVKELLFECFCVTSTTYHVDIEHKLIASYINTKYDIRDARILSFEWDLDDI